MKYICLALTLAVSAWAQSAGKEIGSGAANIGTGAAKGAAVAGKDVTVGTAKGTGQIGKGIGKAFKKLFQYSIGEPNEKQSALPHGC